MLYSFIKKTFKAYLAAAIIIAGMSSLNGMQELEQWTERNKPYTPVVFNPLLPANDMDYLDTLKDNLKAYLKDMVMNLKCDAPSAIATISKLNASPLLMLFYACEASQIRIEDYIDHLNEGLKLSSSQIALALIYIGRIVNTIKNTINKSLMYSTMGYGKNQQTLAIIATQSAKSIVNQYTVHRILLAAVSLAIKTTKDNCTNQNTQIAKCGGIGHRELKRIEVAFMCFIGFDLYVSEQEWFYFISMISKYNSKKTA